MTFFFNGTQANVTLTSTGATINSLMQPAATQTVVSIYKALSGTATETAYTVPAGKTFYMTGINLYNAASTDSQVFDTDGTTILINFASSGVSTNTYTPCSIIQVYNQNVAIKVKSNNASNKFTITGFLV